MHKVEGGSFFESELRASAKLIGLNRYFLTVPSLSSPRCFIAFATNSFIAFATNYFIAYTTNSQPHHTTPSSLVSLG